MMFSFRWLGKFLKIYKQADDKMEKLLTLTERAPVGPLDKVVLKSFK